MVAEARLIALDWGTSNLRAGLLGADGAALEVRSAAAGVMAVRDGRYLDALRSLCGDWLERHDVPVMASGMVGSRQGWHETPYLACPARPSDAARALVRLDIGRGAFLHIVPGLQCVGRDRQPDVMRGEETQLWGAALNDGSCAVLPGTHSKWAWIGADHSVQHFETHMTGELYAVLTQHSILGRLMQHGTPTPDAFVRGVRHGLAEHAGLTHALFVARSAALAGSEPAEGLPDFLSGILIGAEVGAAILHRAPRRVSLIGEPVLCDRYAVALDVADVEIQRIAPDATTRGLWRVARDAGLVKET